ncbi:MAG TPA: AraD1 family protein [Bryobacteraceae bacterium]|nr:AraD1 family protein [Bryobacteraceae bacterium]
MRLVQLALGNRRCAGIVEGDRIRLTSAISVYELAWHAAVSGTPLAECVLASAGSEFLPYRDVYDGSSDWRWLPCADHPEEPSRCLVSGTGLTHCSSAKTRQAMHTGSEELTDSMRMYLAGVEGGRPGPGAAGIAPEWFYKGPGSILRAHLEALTIPTHADDGGEEAEIAGVYLVGPGGRPLRIGMTQGNEFSDHVHEKRNYLYLAESKLRECAIGPELWLDPDFSDVPGEVQIERCGAVQWRKEIRSGEAAMSHSLANLEHHHFKHAQHRRPGDLHVHFYGADALSFADGVRLAAGDTMSVSFRGFGAPLRNAVAIEEGRADLTCVGTL